MSRTYTFAATVETQRHDLRLFGGETLRVAVTSLAPGQTLALTVAPITGDVALLDVPGASAIDLAPTPILSEGWAYRYYLWRVAGSERTVLTYGTLRIEPSIRPMIGAPRSGAADGTVPLGGSGTGNAPALGQGFSTIPLSGGASGSAAAATAAIGSAVVGSTFIVG